MAGIDFVVNITPELARNIEREALPQPKVIHRAATRGHLNEGWLEARPTFSYTGYYNPERLGFGKLRVFNEETIAPGAGFPVHHNENMEIVYIPLEGAIQHFDTLGNSSVIRKGEILVVSAGSGVNHSHYNANRDHMAKYLHVWVYPDRKDTEPRQGKYKIPTENVRNNLTEIVSPDGGVDRAWINQNAWISMGVFDRDYEFRYRLHSSHNGAYVFMIKGESEVNGEKLRPHDGIGLHATRCVDIKACTMAQVLVMEVPVI